MTTITKPVIIAGSGPSGLLLAQGLKKYGIPFHVFERDSALNLRAQGYRFRLTGEAIAALTSILSPDHFALLKNSCGTHMPMNSHHLNAITAEQAAPRGGPRKFDDRYEPLACDRKVFRSVLFKGLEDDVTFDKEIIGYEVQHDVVVVSFADGSSVTGSLLVGADGSWSKVRQQLVPEVAVPFDTEGRIIYGKTIITPEFLDKFNVHAMKGMTLARDETKELPVTLLLEPMVFQNRDKVTDLELPQDYVYWVLTARKDRVDVAGLSKRPTPEECSKLIREITTDWDNSIKPLFDMQDFPQTSILQIGTMRPPLPQWNSSGRVTLVGDATHCMPPTGGIGATTALRDVGQLLKAITEGGISIESLAKYESEMREYAAEAIKMSAMGGKIFFNLKDLSELKPFEH